MLNDAARTARPNLVLNITYDSTAKQTMEIKSMPASIQGIYRFPMVNVPERNARG
ncbi:MAG: hypothetical protein BWY85_01652 [Firmicutes bacterium ADurb.Bin506]|nr:MAG: hypothetical protein BWY85_01652 [Firmicutes bacterium ADurb.Bin506]